MPNHRRLLPALLLLLSGCSLSHPPPLTEDSGPPLLTDDAGPWISADAGPAADASEPDAGPPLVTEGLARCLEAGGTLREVAAVDNNDTRDHGVLSAFAIASVDGELQLAAGGADGTIKVWTLTSFLGDIETTMLTYGPEAPAAPANDMLHHDGRWVIGDSRGVVSSWALGDFMTVLGGTEPDVGIVAVAIDPTGRWLAHAEGRDNGRVMVRELDGVQVFGPLETSLGRVTELAFLPDGALLLAGSGNDEGAITAALELRDATDFTRVLAHAEHGAHGSHGVLEVSVAGGRIAASSVSITRVYDEALLLRQEIVDPEPPTSFDPMPRVVLTADASVLLTLEPGGRLRAVHPDDGTELARLDTGRPGAVGLRMDPRGELLLAGFGTDAHIVAYGCD